MGKKHPTPVSFWRATYLCFVALARPTRFLALQEEDNKRLDASPDAPAIDSIRLVRTALFNSLGLVLGSGIAGILFGCLARSTLGQASSQTIYVLQGIGALILLWATLAVRGWDVLTFNSVTLAERVNLWIYRYLYCAGTFIIILSLAWHLSAGG